MNGERTYLTKEEQETFTLLGKIEDMMSYGKPLLDGFSDTERPASRRIYNAMLNMQRLAITIKKGYRRTSSAESLDIEIEILRRLLRDAADPSKFRPGVKPSLSIKQKNHWCALLDEIGRLVGGYLKSLKNPPRE